MTATAEITTTAVCQWYGSNRLLAHAVGEELEGCSWVGVPFAGGMSELRHITARSLYVGDLHRALINLASVIAHPRLGPKLYRHLRRVPFHLVALIAAQSRCREREETHRDPYTGDNLFGGPEQLPAGPDFEWAADYFVATWMTRAGSAGTDGEYRGGMSIRWDAGGGDSATRFRSAIYSLTGWRRILSRANFVVMDAFAMLAKVKDRPGIGVYCDAPWPDAGDGYRHKFTEAQQRKLADTLGRFMNARVVIRYGDHPLIRELYPEGRWHWRRLEGRTQTNGASDEVLILK